ncbi:MAG: AarF/ABC1/UbiB kinase family protein [Candidatus Eremiobacteraeota bacterium]|nr:AarF/ABC1/UbiB kinase family protein [Candidatus Eremiobacteraeota bacterium]
METTERAPSRAERSRQIVAVLAKHGLAAAGAGLPFRSGNPQTIGAVEAREACEELGTTFIKLAQMLSARADLLPREYRDQLAMLQDSVPPVKTGLIEDAFAGELGALPEALFARFDREPLASASIGQVHAVQLLDGREAVVKVRKPGVRETVERDFEILSGLANSAEKHFPALADYDVDTMLEEFRDTLHAELDYGREARNVGTFAGFFASEKGFWLPEVIPELSTSSVLTMTRVEGVRADEASGLTARRRDAASARVARFVLEPALLHGIFHADPHGGNVLVRSDGSIAVLDFGMTGRLTDEIRRGVADMFLAMHRGDASRLADRLISLAPPARPIDRSALTQKVARLLDRYMSDSLERIEIGVALTEMLEMIRSFGLRSPASLALLFKAVALADGIVLTITPDKPLTYYLEPIADRVAASRLSLDDWSHRARISAMDAAELSIELPRHADRVLSDIERGNLRVWARLEDFEPMLARAERMVERANATMIAAACVVGMTVLFAVYRPAGWQVAAGWLFWVAFAVAVIVGIRTAIGYFSSRRVDS